jgi:hypothetical protein
MQLVRLVSIAVAATMVMAGSAAAQQRAPRPLRGYLVAGAGASIEPTRTTTISAEIAENVRRDLQIYASASYYDNLMSDVARDQLVSVAASLTVATGAPWQFSGRDRGRSFTLGAKFLVPTGATFKPYVGGGLGVINLRRTIVERSRGNLTDSFLAEFGSADGIVDVTQSNTNKPLGEVAAGFGVVVGRGYVDFGYRYRKAFHTQIESLNVSNLSVLAGVRF